MVEDNGGRYYKTSHAPRAVFQKNHLGVVFQPTKKDSYY